MSVLLVVGEQLRMRHLAVPTLRGCRRCDPRLSPPSNPSSHVQLYRLRLATPCLTLRLTQRQRSIIRYHDEQQQRRRRRPAEHDVFAVTGDLARAPVAPQDAAMMQAAENAVLGQAPRGGAAAVMQSAARRNECLGVVPSDEATDAAAEGGVAVTEAHVPGCRVVTEFVADQPVGQYIEEEEEEEDNSGAGSGTATAARQGVVDGTKITIGEALETTVFSAGDQPVEASDAAAIAAAEARATGLDETPPAPGGLAAQARAAADANARAEREGGKTTLRQVLADATLRLGAEVEREDATARPGGVGASIAAAARLNRGRQ